MRGVPAVGVLIALVTSLPAQQIDRVKRTRTITLTERAGLDRVQVPVELSVRFEKGTLKSPDEVRLFRVAGGRVPVACQVLDVTSQAATDQFAPAPQTFVRLAFRADVPARAAAVYEVSLEGGRAAPPEGIKLAGKGLGLTLDCGKAVFQLHDPSGQLLSFTPKEVSADRLVFLQHKERGELPIHWNPDVWLTGGRWGHTNSWNSGTLFDAARHKADAPPASDEKARGFYYREWRGPLLHRLTRWGRMPYAAPVDVSVGYTFHAGSPVVMVQSAMEFREAASVHAVRNAELVFSRHQFDSAVWITKDGKLHRATCYDPADRDRTFGEIARLPADVPCVSLANEKKGYGIAYCTLGLTHLNRRTGQAADEGAHFYVRDYDEHGKGSPANFLYFVRPLVYRKGYLPTEVPAGSLYTEQGAVVVFSLNKDPAKRYDELIRWQKLLTNPLEVEVD
jgi:hypothetical protein